MAAFEVHDRMRSPELSTRIEQFVTSGDSTPMHVDLDLTTECNYRCRHCGDLARGLLNHGGLSRELLDALLDDLRAMAVHEVVLIGGGEPMLSPYFAHALRSLHEYGIACGVVTNGSGMSDAALEAMRVGCTWVRVSLDAATTETYAKIHNPDDNSTLDTVAENVRRMVTSMGARVGVSFLITPLNMHEIEAATRMAKAWGASYIRIRPMQHPITGNPLALAGTVDVGAQLDAAARWRDAVFDVSIGESMAMNGRAAMQPKGYGRCRAQAFGTTISGEGRVYVCSKWRGEPWACIGDLHEERFAAIWKGARRAALLDALSPARQCEHIYCHAHPLNELLAAHVEGVRVTPRFDSA
jgi:MoaA/NifB/PqqE/SkfB family radical SAM enzyme